MTSTRSDIDLKSTGQYCLELCRMHASGYLANMKNKNYKAAIISLHMYRAAEESYYQVKDTANREKELEIQCIGRWLTSHCAVNASVRTVNEQKASILEKISKLVSKESEIDTK